MDNLFGGPVAAGLLVGWLVRALGGSHLLSSPACVPWTQGYSVAQVTVTLEELMSESNPGPQARLEERGLGWVEGGSNARCCPAFGIVSRDTFSWKLTRGVRHNCHWLLHQESSSPLAPAAAAWAGVRNVSQRVIVFCF